ncbi:hypothetical protein HT031_002764 [Scenedesmus sp. PABB004]|nr:hypothetical protein HT031_002764 [Scenedesmus sp. PABB004]
MPGKRYSRLVLVVDNVSGSTPTSDIKYEFSAAGHVSHVARDYDARCALVEFDRSSDAKWAWDKLDGFKMDGRRWKVDWASTADFEMFGWKWNEGRSPSPARGRSHSRSRSRTPPITPHDKDRKRGGNSASSSPPKQARSGSVGAADDSAPPRPPLPKAPSASSHARRSARRTPRIASVRERPPAPTLHAPLAIMPGKRYSRLVLVVDNVSGSTPTSDIKYEFSAAGHVSHVARDYDARCALVEFDRSSDAKWAWDKLDGFKMDGRRWKVDWASTADFEMFGWKWNEGRSPSPARGRSHSRSRSRTPPITPHDKDRKRGGNSASSSPPKQARSGSVGAADEMSSKLILQQITKQITPSLL